MGESPHVESIDQLEHTADDLIATTIAAVDKHTPHAKPSPYSKRWFTPELKIQQREVNRLRRKWQESCANTGPVHPRSMGLFIKMHTKRREWTRLVEKVKNSH